MSLITRNYLVEFADGDHAYSTGRDGGDAARAAQARWGVPVVRWQIPGLGVAWVSCPVVFTQADRDTIDDVLREWAAR